jgi:hypothetical protein
MAEACPGCGHPIAAHPVTAPTAPLVESGATPTWLVVIGVIAGILGALLFIGYLIGSTPEAKEQATDRRAIELCKDDLRKQSLGSGTESFVRNTCEMMANKFEQKYGSRP